MPLTKIKSLGITDGTITGDDINSTFNLTGKTVTLPAGTGGKVLQVVQTVKTDTYTSTATSMTDVTGMSVSITPSSASNKVLVIIHANVSNDNGNRQFLHLRRNTNTEIYRGDAAGSRARASTSFYVHSSLAATAYYGTLPVIISYLDSPNTTSSTTYKLSHSSGEGLQFGLNRSYPDSDSTSEVRSASSITVMEIAG